ncbi:MAG: adenylate/guanylate cyclase domain-containing protein [Bacteriovoracia bacterium]
MEGGPSVDRKPDLAGKVLELSLRDAAERAGTLSLIFALLFGSYGFTSLDFINRFDPSVTLWQNVVPRLFFCALPFFLLGLFIKKSNASDLTKFNAWVFGFPVILHVTAWIHIWPIALWKSANILTYVNEANLFLYGAVFAGVGPPRRYLVRFCAGLVAIFILPLFVVAFLTWDKVILNLLIGDTFLSLSTSIFVSHMIDKLRAEVAYYKLEKEMAASQFLGPVLSKAIFENQQNRLERVRCRGYIVCIDIRDSTTLQSEFGERWLEFRKRYFALVSQCVSRNHGYIQKTVGDCHVINFGVMDYGVDLSDIPGLESELERADDRRLKRASDSVFRFFDELFTAFEGLDRSQIEDRPISLGAGVDKGWVERGVQGDAATNSLELDVNGDPVNCANRLQEYSKYLKRDMEWGGSLLVISPFAADYISDFSSFLKHSTTDNPVRNYNGIKWVLSRKYGGAQRQRPPLKLAA